jgi:hypothetical protein
MAKSPTSNICTDTNTASAAVLEDAAKTTTGSSYNNNKPPQQNSESQYATHVQRLLLADQSQMAINVALNGLEMYKDSDELALHLDIGHVKLNQQEQAIQAYQRTLDIIHYRKTTTK